MHPPQDTSILGQNTVQTWAGDIHPRLAVPTELHENKNEAIHGMDVNVDPIQMSMNVPECMSMQEIQWATAQGEHLQWLKGYIIGGWQESKDHLHQDIRVYWPFKDDMAVIDGVIQKGRHIIIPEILKAQVLEQLHINCMGIKKTKLLVCESIYWANINDNIENFIKKCTTCLTFQQTQPKNKIIHHDILIRLWDIINADMFTLNNKQYLCIGLQPNQIPNDQED